MVTSLVFITLAIMTHVSAEPNEKRGLCFVPNPKHPQDYKVWVQPGSDLTWYYNYGNTPSPEYSQLSQEEFEFVPMMWGVGANPEDTTFLEQVKSLVKGGRNITHVLGFNEPDAGHGIGGSNISPETAAQAWVANFEPLGEMGIQLGLPACTGGWGSMPWLKSFLGNCSEILSNGGEEKNCTWDFVPVHWYDNFEGLASHIGERRAEWPDKDVWVTEFAYAHQELGPTEQFFNATMDYFDKEPYIGKYTWFGAFRSDVSNVGVNSAFMNKNGQLTEIGVEYLGINGTGIDPNDSAASGLVVPGLAAMVAIAIGVLVKEFL